MLVSLKLNGFESQEYKFLLILVFSCHYCFYCLESLFVISLDL